MERIATGLGFSSGLNRPAFAPRFGAAGGTSPNEDRTFADPQKLEQKPHDLVAWRLKFASPGTRLRLEHTVVTTHRHLAAGALALAVLIAAPACATGPYLANQGRSVDYREMDRWAFNNGYHDGRVSGERDARGRQPYRMERDREYQRGDSGYYSRGGYPLYQYREMFRRGFEAGYNDGYARYARSNGRAPGSWWPGNAPPVAGNPRGYDGSSAASNGYKDGFDAGREDAREKRSYDPRRPKLYREGDRGYSGSSVSRDDYKRDYRDAFIQGYEQGYREFR
jgi:hypothetical protein